MIDLDLERRLAPLVERAPTAPPVSGVRTRARTRRRRRNLVPATGAVVLVAVVAATVAARAGGHRRAPDLSAVPDPSSTSAPPDGTATARRSR